MRNDELNGIKLKFNFNLVGVVSIIHSNNERKKEWVMWRSHMTHEWLKWIVLMKMIGFCLKNEWNDKPAIQFLFDLNQNEINGGGSEIHSVFLFYFIDAAACANAANAAINCLFMNSIHTLIWMGYSGRAAMTHWIHEWFEWMKRVAQPFEWFVWCWRQTINENGLWAAAHYSANHQTLTLFELWFISSN